MPIGGVWLRLPALDSLGLDTLDSYLAGSWVLTKF